MVFKWGRAALIHRPPLNIKGNKNDELRIQRCLRPPHTGWRYLGNYQYFPKLSFEREEATLDHRSGAATRVGLGPLVLPWTAWSRGVANLVALGCEAHCRAPRGGKSVGVRNEPQHKSIEKLLGLPSHPNAMRAKSRFYLSISTISNSLMTPRAI